MSGEQSAAQSQETSAKLHGDMLITAYETTLDSSYLAHSVFCLTDCDPKKVQRYVDLASENLAQHWPNQSDQWPAKTLNAFHRLNIGALRVILHKTPSQEWAAVRKWIKSVITDRLPRASGPWEADVSPFLPMRNVELLDLLNLLAITSLPDPPPTPESQNHDSGARDHTQQSSPCVGTDVHAQESSGDEEGLSPEETWKLVYRTLRLVKLNLAESEKPLKGICAAVLHRLPAVWGGLCDTSKQECANLETINDFLQMLQLAIRCFEPNASVKPDSLVSPDVMPHLTALKKELVRLLASFTEFVRSNEKWSHWCKTYMWELDFHGLIMSIAAVKETPPFELVTVNLLSSLREGLQSIPSPVHDTETDTTSVTFRKWSECNKTLDQVLGATQVQKPAVGPQQ